MNVVEHECISILQPTGRDTLHPSSDNTGYAAGVVHSREPATGQLGLDGDRRGSGGMRSQPITERNQLCRGDPRTFGPRIHVVPCNGVRRAPGQDEDMLVKVRHTTSGDQGEDELRVQLSFERARHAPRSSRDGRHLRLDERRQHGCVPSRLDGEVTRNVQSVSRGQTIRDHNLFVAVNHRAAQRPDTPVLVADRTLSGIRTGKRHRSRSLAPAAHGRDGVCPIASATDSYTPEAAAFSIDVIRAHDRPASAPPSTPIACAA